LLVASYFSLLNISTPSEIEIVILLSLECLFPVLFSKKCILQKSVTNVEIAFEYILRYVKNPSYKVTTLICMYDI